MLTEPTEFSRLLQQADAGDQEAADRLYRLVQGQLRAIAKKRKQQLQRGADMSTTALVNQAFLQVVGQEITTWPTDSRQKFFSYIATAMHGLLIDTARAQSAKKRGGEFNRVEGEDGRWDFPKPDQLDDVNLLLDLKAALRRFEEFAELDTLIFRVRYFLGLTFDELADVLGVSATSAKRSFERAKSWLQRELKEYCDDA